MITCDQLELEFKNEFEKGFGRIHSTFNNGEDFLLFHKHHLVCVTCASNATHCDTWWLLQLPLWTCLYQCRTVQINLFRSYTDPHTINIQMNIIWRLFLYHSNFDPEPTDRSVDYWLKYIGSSEIYSEIMKADKYNIQVELGRPMSGKAHWSFRAGCLWVNNKRLAVSRVLRAFQSQQFLHCQQLQSCQH